ncbi:MAG: autotransporter-associated beta strand repeat-containing protein [Luteolibacter sp.]
MKTKHFPLHSIRLAFLGLSAVGLSSFYAQATTVYWDTNGATAGAGASANGTWSATTSGFWTTSSAGTSATSNYDVANGGSPSTADVVFSAGTDATTSANVTLSGAVVASSITVEELLNITSATTTPSLTLGAGGVTINSTVGANTTTWINTLPTILSASQNWTNNASGLFTANGTITGAASTAVTFGIAGTGNTTLGGIIANGATGGTVALTKSDGGTLILGAVNTYTGGTTVSAGILRINVTTGAANTGTFNLGGGTLQINQAGNNFGYAPTINLTADSTVSNIGAGAINYTGPLNGNTHALTVNNTGARLYVNGAASGVTQFNVTAGAMGFDLNVGNRGGGAAVVVSNGASLWFANATATLANNITLNGGTGQGGTGALALESGTNLTPILSGTLTLNSGDSSIGNTGTANAGNNISVTGLVTGTGSLTKMSINKLSLSNAASDYTGTTTVSAGTLNVGTFANVNTVSSLGKGSAGGSSADLVLNGGTLQYTGATAQSTNRLFSVGSSGATLDASGTSGAVALAFTGTGAMGFNSQTGARTLTLTGTNTASNSLALAIGDNSGATSITKTGAGTWALGGTNTYSGATTLTTGALSFLNTAAKSASTTVTAAAGTTVGLGVGGAGFFSSADVASLLANTLAGFNLDAAALAGIDTTAGDLTFDTTGLSGTRGLVKLGANTLSFSGTNTFVAATRVTSGTLEYQTAAAMSSSSALTMGNGGTLSLRADVDTTFTPASLTGAAGSYTIAVNQITGAGAGKTLTLANTFTFGASGSNLTVSSTSGDTLLLSSQLAMFNASSPTGTINLSGADMTLNTGVTFNNATNGPLLVVNANSNTLVINGNYTTGNNRWAGITLNNGTLTLANGQNGGSSTNNGVYAILNGGTLNLNNANAIGGANAGNNFIINGGTLDNTSGSTKTMSRNPNVTINGDFAFSTLGGTSANNLSLGTNTISLGSSAGTTRTITTNGSGTLTLGGVISNGTNVTTPTTAITKAGPGTLALTGTNTYTGDTTVNAGVLSVDGDAIANANKLIINGGKVDPMGATEVVNTLYFGATQQAGGKTYGSLASDADIKSDTYFVIGSTGKVNVTTGPAGYTGWADANAPGQTKNQDHDNDGVSNGIEYFMGLSGPAFTANPGPVSGTVTWPMGATYTGVYGTDYEVQTSTDLVTWTQVPVGTGDNTVTVTVGTSVVYDMPTGGKSFVRLVVKN